MRIVDAISKSLKDLGRPSTYEEVYDHIVTHNYFDFGAEDPKSVVRVKLKVHCANTNIMSARGKAKYFESHGGKGKEEKFFLLDKPQEASVKETVDGAESPSMDKIVIGKNENKGLLYFRDKAYFFGKWLIEILKPKRKDVHKMALIECFWMLLGAFLPIIFDSLLRVTLLSSKFIEAVTVNVKGGEVFLLTSTLITPFYFLLYKYMTSDDEYRKENKLPFFGWIFPLTILSTFAGVFAFSYYRIGVIIKQQYTDSPASGMFDFQFGSWAWGIYLISLSIWYYAAYMSHLGTGEYKKIRKKQFSELSEQYEETKGAV